MSKERLVVICPGRGTYTKETLGYLKKFGAPIRDYVNSVDQWRENLGQSKISDLDGAEKFQPHVHTKGENASMLIHSCSYADFLSIDQNKFEVVAITGNSMGWYIALALSGALKEKASFEVINTMGSMMKEQIIGGQVIYPIIGKDWRIDKEQESAVFAIVDEINSRPECESYLSIRLGGYLVLAGNKPGVAALLKELPQIDDYPFQLINHAAFHTPLLRETSDKALRQLPSSLFSQPQIPLVDGRGKIWPKHYSDLENLYDYTFRHQVYAAYDFTAAVSVCLKEFAPDRLVLLGPGSTLGGSIGQIMIQNNWKNLKNKTDFQTLQEKDPFLVSMGREDQRKLVLP